jgi:hypothetical protein
MRERFQSGELLHQKLHKETVMLWGVDVDQAGIDFLIEKGFKNLLCLDLSEDRLPDALNGIEFDVIILSEVIEHLLNPGRFLKSVAELMTPGHTRLLVTVPNAFSAFGITEMLKGIEYVHPDHNYWFSYQTVRHLLRKVGLNVEDVYVYTFQKDFLVARLRKRLKQYPGGPAVAETIHGNRRNWQRLSVKRLIRFVVNHVRRNMRKVWISYLYSKSPFWGDGIILLCTKE